MTVAQTYRVSGFLATVTVELTMTAESVDAAIRRASLLVPMIQINNVQDAAGNSYLATGAKL